MKRALSVLIGLMLCGAAWAQSAPPYGTFSTFKTGVITSTLLFTQALSSSYNGARHGCLFQNDYTGTATTSTPHNMFVAFTSTQPSLTSTAFIVAPLGTISCGLAGGGVVLDAMWFTGLTAGDPYAYSSQP